LFSDICSTWEIVINLNGIDLDGNKEHMTKINNTSVTLLQTFSLKMYNRILLKDLAVHDLMLLDL